SPPAPPGPCLRPLGTGRGERHAHPRPHAGGGEELGEPSAAWPVCSGALFGPVWRRFDCRPFFPSTFVEVHQCRKGLDEAPLPQVYFCQLRQRAHLSRCQGASQLLLGLSSTEEGGAEHHDGGGMAAMHLTSAHAASPAWQTFRSQGTAV